MKTKVWIVVWGLKDGGAETLARDYARFVDQTEFEPTLITMYPFTNTANYRLAAEAGLRICSVFKRRNVITRAVRVLAGKWCVPMILKGMIREQCPDTIHFNTKAAHYFAPLKKHLSGIRLLYTCHNEPDKHFFPKEEAAVRKLICDHKLRLIALHEDMKLELDQRFAVSDTVVIRNGVDFTRFCNVTSNKEETLKSIGIAPDAYVVGHIGRFSAAKNHMFLLEVFRQIVASKPQAHLLLIGSGELKDQVVQEISRLHLEERVTILSHRSDIPDLLRAMDVMVFPSFFEGLSVVLVEAQASGLKCVISDSINSANLLSDRTIPLSLNEDAQKWASVVLDDEIRNLEYGKLEDYDMKREIRRLERLYLGELDV